MSQKKKKKITKGAKRSRSKVAPHSVASLLPKRALLTLAVFIVMSYGLTNISVTTPISAQSSPGVLGDEDENKEEEKREEKKEEKKEERREENRHEEESKPEEQKNNSQERSSEKRGPQIEPFAPRSGSKVEKQKRIESQNDSKDTPEIENEIEDENESEDLDEVELENIRREKETILIKQNETEIRTTDGQRIKTKIEDDGTKKIEIEGKNYKLKYVIRDGKLRVEAESENGESVDIPDEATSELENSFNDELEQEGIEIDSSEKEPTIVKNGFKAKTAFPLTIDPITKALTITTPTGDKQVTILPDQAIANLKASGVLDNIEVADGSSVEGESEIVEYKNKITYKIKGTKRHRVFGFIAVNLPATVYVSAETGEPFENEQSLLTKIIDSISL
ncbi:hypothetical protein A2957_00120 [Candidatus Roizmanbacteria bacterium RIFCSPLOWO2_01_FULL_38_11]|uniref:Uncharacterized protein n=1 Tax=Candidatus Roizmanbacteria bacterium RIFCSPLOWO2_01_FULL_38_11 TaxID=1802060 RepID=A0A1F7IMX6_9BACT|nr:MAG: hypothetical protein A2957_00120 [Candidatus Roizmanbacteria bacterium RIFCSPLOWO2_01_FULL_38_11]